MIRLMIRMKRTRAFFTYVSLFFFSFSSYGVFAQPFPPVFPSGAPPPGLMRPPMPGQPPGQPSNGGNESTISGQGTEKLILLNFRDSPLDQVLEFVADLLDRTMIKSPGINATVTLKSQSRLNVKESLQAIEAVLAMNNITLVPMGDKFLKVVQTGQARMEGMPIELLAPKEGFAEDDKLISQVVVLKYIDLAEIQPIIQSLIHGYGKIQSLERTNSMLITDTASNLKRIMEILEYIDQPTESKIETRIYEIHYAEAGKVASKLNELIADTQAKEDKPRVETTPQHVPPPFIPTPPGVIRARAPGIPESAGGEGESALQLAERGIIRGKVKIIADERTNILFVLSRIENFAFFDRIVAVLDRPVEPEVTVRVVALEYAKADEISGILNEFIGAATSDASKIPPGAAPAQGAPGTDQAAADARSQSIREFIAQRVQARAAEVSTAGADAEKSGIGRVSANTKILADKRTNSLLLMGKKSDLDVLEEIINSLDTMLAQVLIETVIIEVNLGKNLNTGIDWLQRSVTAYNKKVRGPGGGLTVYDPVYAFGGGSSQGGDPDQFRDASQITDRSNLPLSAGALTYYLTFFDLNIDAILRLAANSRDARILQTPIILTTDNTEAKINVGEQRPVVTSTSTTDTGTQTQNFEYKNIGIQLTVTPRINPQRFVILEVSQSADNVNGFETINGNRVPIITKRDMQAQIAVKSRSTIALGGLVLTDKGKTRSKIPFLGDIPFFGALFRSDAMGETRTELLVLITPYVLTTPEEARAETVRLHSNSFSSKTRWHAGWSDSELGRTPRDAKKRTLSIEEQTPLPPKSHDVFSGEDSPEPETPGKSIDESQEVTPGEHPDALEPMAEQEEPALQSDDAAAIPVTQPPSETATEPAPVPVSADDANAPVPMR
ncbi:MAG: type II secretion system secretin GspD [bacterium]